METRFLDSLLAQYRRTKGYWNAQFVTCLESDNTKRILFDSRQASLFDAIEGPEQGIRQLLHLPFPNAYLEFTEPILLSTQEPGKQDFTRAFLWREMPDTVSLNIGEEQYSLPVINLTTFLHSGNEFVDRSWLYSYQIGLAFTKAGTARAQGSTLPEMFKDDNWIAAKMRVKDTSERAVGWWEEHVDSVGTLFSYLLAYMMAKGVSIVPAEHISRQQRRWLAARGRMPNPWHTIQLDPRIVRAHGNEEAEYHHGYRYDVIGHLRFNKHRTVNGYKHTIEWVSPHQRGLANEIYIPKTYRVDTGKIPAPEMREYWHIKDKEK